MTIVTPTQISPTRSPAWSPQWIIDDIHERILPLQGHVPTSNQTEGELAPPVAARSVGAQQEECTRPALGSESQSSAVHACPPAG